VETFLIRIWTPAERYRLRGLVEHIASGERDAFRGGGELLAVLELRLGRKAEEVTQ
jgi:hypothetical protein